MELSKDEIERIKKLLSAKPVDRGAVKPAAEVSLGCEFCTGNCIGSCQSTCSDLQEFKPRPEQEDDSPSYDYDCEECGSDCYGSCYQGCKEECSGECQNSCYSRCGATCEFCCEGQCGVTVSSEPEDAIRKRGCHE